MSARSLLALAGSMVLLVPTAWSQNTAPASNIQDIPVIRATRREVLVDLVVRDKHHRLVTNLKPEEIEVYEDGVLQKVNAFRGVSGSEQLQSERGIAERSSLPGTHPSSVEPAPPLTSLRQINFVAIVLAEIAPLNLEFAREAVRDFLHSDNLPNTYVSIYKLDRTLKIAQYYTENKDVLEKAVDGAARGAHAADALTAQAAVVGSADASLQAIADNILANPGTDPTVQLAVRNALLEPFPTIVKDPLFARNAAAQDVSATLGMAVLAQARIENGIRFAQSLANGMDTLDALHDIVRSQENLPGRKVVLYLSDGLEFPMNRRDAVESLISYANRAGVAFYAVNTQGLNVEDPMMRSLAELERTGAVSSAQRVDPANGHKEDDDIQLTVSSNKQLALRELAEATGGFVVSDTNEIAAPMERVMEDIRSHYELAYTPTSTIYDGRFRKIEVRVTRPHLTVQTRKGYFALPDLNGNVLQPFEAAALNAINSKPITPPFAYRVAVMKLRPRPDLIEHEVAFEIPLSALHAASSPNGGTARLKTSVVALIHDAKGEVVGKIGRQLTRELSKSELSQVNSEDHILYAEPVELPPGHYVVDTAVTDEQSGQTAVKRLALFVDSGKDFGISSLELVRSRETRQTVAAASDAAIADARITPTLSESVPSGKPMFLYFIVYPKEATSSERPLVMLQVLRDGKEIARRAVHLPQPSPDGSVPVMLKLSPEPGQCDIFVTAQQGTLAAQSSLSVKVE